MDRSTPLNLAPMDLRRAIRDLDQAINQDPADILAHYGRALAYHNMGVYNQALCSCERALELDRAFVPAHYCRGIARYGLGEYRRAIREYRRSLELDPDYAPAYLGLGIVHSVLREHCAAVGDIERWSAIDEAYKERRELPGAWGRSLPAIAGFSSTLQLLEDDSRTAIENSYLALPRPSFGMV